MKKRLVALSLAAGVLGGALLTPFVENAWGLAAARGFAIPKESSIFTFRVTRMNDGSGEWWLYGEDFRNFYGVPDANVAYFVFPRAKVAQCPGFDPRDTSTWCPRLVTAVR
jgi:hypothetical protein